MKHPCVYILAGRRDGTVYPEFGIVHVPDPYTAR